MLRRWRKSLFDPIAVSERFTVQVVATGKGRSSIKGVGLWNALMLVFDASYDAASLNSSVEGLVVRLTDLETGRIVDDDVGTWNGWVDADYRSAVRRLTAMDDAEVLRRFFDDRDAAAV